jgi:plastocyanin
MKRALLRCSITAAAGAAALLVPGSGLAGGPQPHVSIEFGDYAPARIDVVAGDEVNWSNDSVRNHTVTDDHGAYDSGSLHAGSQFNHVFAQPGSFPYHCRLHSYIRGEVDVYDLLLAPEPVPAQADQPFPLRGRSALPPDTPISVEANDGTGYRAVASTTVGPDGDFTATVTPTASATYRAVAGSEQSPPVQLLVPWPTTAGAPASWPSPSRPPIRAQRSSCSCT